MFWASAWHLDYVGLAALAGLLQGERFAHVGLQPIDMGCTSDPKKALKTPRVSSDLSKPSEGVPIP